MFTLTGLGVGVAYIYSVTITLFPQIFHGVSGKQQAYFEAASVIVTLVLLGQVLELKARAQSSSAMRALLGLAAKTARIIRPDGSFWLLRSNIFGFLFGFRCV